MEFKKYSSLENHYNGKFISKIRDHGLDTGEWVAREKIHGTNFSVIITKDSITPAKRTGIIESSESFFGYDIIMKKYQYSFKAIQNSLLRNELNRKGISELQIFGEFAGHGIQKEVDYGEKDFYVFDILVDENGQVSYLPDTHVESICSYYDLKVAPLLGRGGFEELSQLPNDFQSRVIEYNGLYSKILAPKPNPTDINEANSKVWEVQANEEGDNVSEGYVLKPNVPQFLPNGSRVAIKSKNSKFTEKKKSDRPIQPAKEFTPADFELLAQFAQYNTWNRVLNVVSKLGEITAKDFGKVMGLTMQDIFVEAEREGLEITQAEDPVLVKKALQKLVMEVIRERWVELL